MRARAVQRPWLSASSDRCGHAAGYGDAEQTILLLPAWQIAHSRIWKGQIPYLARSFRVLTFDPPGNGRCDRPEDARAYGKRAVAAAIIAELV